MLSDLDKLRAGLAFLQAKDDKKLLSECIFLAVEAVLIGRAEDKNKCEPIE